MSGKRPKQARPPEEVASFFARCDLLDRMVLRPLAHMASDWETTWDEAGRCYRPEDDSFASDLNEVIGAIASSARPVNYHDNEDRVVERVRTGRPLHKEGRRWVVEDYASVLERGSWGDPGQTELIAAAAGRAHAALDHGHETFDDMEWGHLVILAGLLSIIIDRRHPTGASAMARAARSDDGP